MKEAPKRVDAKPAMTADPMSDQEKQSGKVAIFPLDEDKRSYLVAREKKNRKLWKTYSYEIVSFVPRDPLVGGDDQWLVEKDAPLPFDLRVHVNAKNAVEHAGSSVKARKEQFEEKAERKRERLEHGRWKAFRRRLQ